MHVVSLPWQNAHLAHWPVGILEVGLEKSIKKVASDTLDSVINREHMDALPIFDVSALRNRSICVSESYITILW